MPSVIERLQHGWNAFMGRDPTTFTREIGFASSYRPDRTRFSLGNEKTVTASIFNRIAMDVASINLRHVRVDEDGRYLETIRSGLNNCLTLDANLDQTGRAFIQDATLSMFDEGCVALVPTDTTFNPQTTGSYDIEKMRVAKVVEWFPDHVRLLVYNERKGDKVEIVLPKSMVAIVENPLYAVMNEPNSTLQRLLRTLSQLDIYNRDNATGKLDLIIQLPYVVSSPKRREQAENRRKDIEMQLVGSKYGVAYTDGTERITQLNRPVENTLWTQAKELTAMLYNQLGLTESVFDGTADEKTMINYYNRTIDPILSAFSEEMMRKFLTKTARTQGQAIKYFRDPFKLVPVSELADIADKFTRNEIASSNEMRAEIGWKPSDDPRADQLVNKNINQSGQMDQQIYGEDEGQMIDEE